MASRKKSPVFRVTGLSALQQDDELREALKACIDDNLVEDERSIVTANTAIVPSCYNEGKVALVEFLGGVPIFLSELMVNPLADWQVEMGEIDLNFDQHFLDFTQLYTPKPDRPITADIIAISGLDGHAYGSWRGKGNLRRMWLRDFLSKDLPSCRTMIYGYNSKLSTNGVDAIMDYGRGLLEELKKIRNTEELRKRPLFFIAHSFGGIILAHCLIKAAQTDDKDHPTVASLLKATYGMLLFGMPHKGLAVDDIQKIIAGGDKNPQKALLDQISRQSDVLANQLVDFKNLIRDRKVVSFYEMGKTRQLEFDSDSGRWRRTGDFVTAVDSDSALLQLPDSMEDKIPLNADHSMIVKFDNKNSRGYTSARDKLQQFEQDASRVVSARFLGRVNQFDITFSLSEVPEVHNFVGREREIQEMRQSLSFDGSRHIAVLHGLGGIGKTQLAVAYIKKYRDEHSAIFWLNIKDETTIQQSFTKVVRQILQQHPNASCLSALDLKKNDNEIVEAVKTWLSLPNNTRWLAVYDNYDNPRLPNGKNNKGIDIRQFLPTAYQGSIIITTRLSQVDIGHPIRIRKLESMNDSLAILSSTSGRDGLHGDTDAKRLVEKLDGLPLALATAGAYLRRVSTSLIDYLRYYEKSWARLHTSTPRLGSYEDRTLCSTWQVSYEQVQEQDPLAAHLLQWWAYFDNEDLWFELLQVASKHGPPWMHDLADELNFNNAMGTLHDYGFIEPHNFTADLIESRGYSIHACLHSWTIHILNQAWDHHLSRVAVKCVALRVPSSHEAQFWLLERRLLPHAIASYAILQNNDEEFDWVFYNLGFLYAGQDKFQEAEEMYTRALQGMEKAYGPGHTSTLNTVNNLALIYASRGKLPEAEEMYVRALQGKEKVYGPDHTSTLHTVNNLANLYANQGKLQEAERMYVLALQGMEKAYESDHKSTLLTVNNLASLYQSQGKLQKAEKMYMQTLQGMEKAHGPDHAPTLLTVNNLANLYKDQGKLQQAEEMYVRALYGMKKAYGPGHTSTLNTVNDIANLYTSQGKLPEAEEMYMQALQGKEKAFGPDHKSTLNTVNSLANLYRHQGKLEAAIELMARFSLG